MHYQAASADGSKIFFTEHVALDRDSSSLHPIASPSGERQPMPISTNSTSAAGKLTDLTATERSGDPADVLGTLPGASEDGSYVYFVANGVLAPGSEPGNCPNKASPAVPPVGAPCNLYVSEPDPRTPRAASHDASSRVCPLTTRPTGDWAEQLAPSSLEAGDLTYVTARVSPNGRYLAFMSDRSLTGYDNNDATSKAPANADEEVFLYDARLGQPRLRLVQPERRTAAGRVRHSEASGEGLGLLVDRPGRLEKTRWLAGSIPAGLQLSDHQRRSTSRATSPTAAGCSSTAPTRSSRRTKTPRRTSTSTSRTASAAARSRPAASR